MQEADMNQRKASAHYYLLDDMLLESRGCANLRKRRPLSELQLLAGLVWARERGPTRCPVVQRQRHQSYSEYCWPSKRGDGGIVRLIREHLCCSGLLHELAHGLGPNDKLEHGPAFRRRCIHLYKLYGDWNGEIDW
jgi:hypothetical protein